MPDMPAPIRRAPESLAQTDSVDVLISQLKAHQLLPDNWNPAEHKRGEDDGGNEIETVVDVKINSIEGASTLVKIAAELGFGVMPIGSRTSAVKAFEAESQAKLHGLKGWIGLQMSSQMERIAFGELWEDERSEQGHIEIEGQCYAPIEVLNGQARILKSLNPGTYPHRIQSWGGVTPAQLDEALKSELGHGHSVYLDLTTRDSAQVAAVTATGGQGPTRADARNNLSRAIIINHKGERVQLRGQEAKKQVGLGGLAGSIMMTEFEVVHEPKNEFGIFIPLPGDLRDGLLERFPTLMAKLAKYTKTKTDSTGKTLPFEGELILKGFEIVTRDGMGRTFNKLSSIGDPATGRAGALNEAMTSNGATVGLMINGRTDLEDQTHIADTIVGLLELDQDEPLVETEPTVFQDSKMSEFRRVREGMAEAARASKLEGPTKSTDLNVKINSEDPEEIKQAYAAIWKIYYDYIKIFGGDYFQIHLYGHNHPGAAGDGGGIDAHIRITLPLTDQESFDRAPEHLMRLKEAQGVLYSQLIALNGQHGIQISPGEKGTLLNAEHLRWMEENEPEKTEEIYRYIQTHGGNVFGLREGRFQLHAYPPRIKEGILKLFAPDPECDSEDPIVQRQKSIHYYVQNSHRSAEWQRVSGEVLGLIRDWLGLGFKDRVFFTESPEKALHTALLSLNDYQAGGEVLDLRGTPSYSSVHGNIQTIVTTDASDLDDDTFAHCKKILIIEDDRQVSEEERAKADIVIYSAEAFGTGGELGIVVTNTQTIQHARSLKAKGNKMDVVHSLIKLNDKPNTTIETPKMQVMAELGCALASKMRQAGQWEAEQARLFLEEQSQMVTFGPGPSQLNRYVIDQSISINAEAKRLKEADARERIAKVDEIKARLKEWLGIPADYDIFFTGSATQAMQQIAESVQAERSVVARAGAFGDRHYEMVKHFSPPHSVKPNSLRWGEADVSTQARSIGEMRANLNGGSGSKALYLTGHETSTGAQFELDHIIEALRDNHPQLLTIVDGTSEAGGVKRNFENIDVYFWSVQKFFGLPAGLGIVAVSPKAMEQAQQTDQKLATQKQPRYGSFTQMMEQARQGEFHNLRGILQVGAVLEDWKVQFENLSGVVRATRGKMDILTEAIDGCPGLSWAVRHIGDRSEVLLHVQGVSEETRRGLGVILGEGYGPYVDLGDLPEVLENEIAENGWGGRGPYTRIYLGPNVSKEQVQTLADSIKGSHPSAA